MEDSTQFMQWALSTLQHEQPPPGTPAPAAGAYDDVCDTTVSSIPVLGYSASVDCMVPGEPPAREGQRATNSWSSVDTDSGSGGGSASATAWSAPQHSSVRCAAATAPGSCNSGTNQPVSWDFNSASAQLIIKEARPPNSAAAAAPQAETGVAVPQMARHGSPPTRRASAKISASSSSAPYSQDHIIAERKRREKINQRFIELSTVIPGLKKMDKATILSDATRYVRELQEKLRALQQDGGGRGMESAVLASKKPRIAAPDDDEDGGAHPYAVGGQAATGNNALPEIEVRISEGDAVMVRIHCRDAKGVVVMLLAEVEGLHLSITHSNVMQFSASVLIINVMAKASSR
ncbi:transcription factor bHLH18-like [Panicum miliaceum]|uniref:Transcription factor bHLH18-like n=1 Tax=Panicum miliaceum TaxID=4540 RepID=A0A3L6TJE6_PANMI|nr:transcription factor bHLH18-like [Panicum miliaceum]